MFALAEDWSKVSNIYKLRPLMASPKLNGVRAQRCRRCTMRRRAC
jgi:hypothetical protein